MSQKQPSSRQSQSLPQRRISSHSLGPLQMPLMDNYEAVTMSGDDNTTNNEVVEEGKELFQNFVVQEIERESPEVLNEVPLAISTPQGYKNPLWAKTGRDLRLLADQFARTKEREAVRQRAEGVEIDINYEAFRDLLSELFRNNRITNERIVVLFYFCSDITIRSLHKGKEFFQRFYSWCINFIAEKVCGWVQAQGGWSQVLRSPFNSYYKMAIWGLAVLSVALLVGYRYRRFN